MCEMSHIDMDGLSLFIYDYFNLRLSFACLQICHTTARIFLFILLLVPKVCRQKEPLGHETSCPLPNSILVQKLFVWRKPQDLMMMMMKSPFISWLVKFYRHSHSKQLVTDSFLKNCHRPNATVVPKKYKKWVRTYFEESNNQTKWMVLVVWHHPN